jgi:phosphoglycerate dehydrogenase-like enzyme
MSKRLTILVCTKLKPETLMRLRQHADVDVAPELRDEALRDQLQHYQGLIVDGTVYLSASVLEQGETLRVIGCTSSHIDRIDVTAARDYGIQVISAPTGNAVVTAEQVMMLVLQFAEMGVSGKTLGLVGYGATAQQVAHRARAFNMRVVVNQPRLTPELALEREIELLDLPALLAQSDFISLHLPARDEVLLNSAEIAQIKPNASLINLAHPLLVDLDSLIVAAGEGKIANVAIGGNPAKFYDLPSNFRVVPRPTQLARERSEGSLIRKMVDILRIKLPSETLSLDIVPIEQVMPHEAFDQKRVDKIKSSFEEAGVLMNPPLVTPWAGKYVILDGATRYNTIRQLGYPHIAVQLVDPEGDFTLHTWYHAISNKQPVAELFAKLRAMEGVKLSSFEAGNWLDIFNDPHNLCYFIDRDDNATLLSIEDLEQQSTLRNAIVETYTQWGEVERTLLTDTSRLLGQFPDMAAVAIFPQFKPTDVFDVARHGQLLPAGLTRFVVSNRVLHLNAPLELLKSAEQPIAAKKAWLDNYLADKLARSRVRYFQEPVILIDE